MKREKMKYVGIALIFLLCGVYYLCTQHNSETDVFQVQTTEETKEIEMTGVPEEEKTKEQQLIVHVCGAVVNPGVYTMKPEERVYQAILAAGGTLPEAAADGLNQAGTLEDGMQLYVPYQGEATVSTEESSRETGVNINVATKEELMTLPGIGESKAEAIIAYRQEHGDFQRIEDLTNISGIKSGVYEKIKEQIRIR